MNAFRILLATSVASIAVTGAALAADLPVTKADPVEYVRVCSTYGTGFFYVPGTDTCIQLSGRLRADYVFIEPNNTQTNAFAAGNGRYKDATGIKARARLNVDVRTPTEYGTLRAYLRFQIDKNSGNQGSGNGALLDKAYIQWAGITAGHAQSFFDFYASDLNWGSFGGAPGSDTSTNLLAYTASFGSGFSATISLEDRGNRELNAAGIAIGSTTYRTYDRAGQRLPDIVANLRVEQDWGSAQLSGALHQLNSGSIHDPWGTGQWGQRVDTTYGWAVQGGVKLKLPALGAGDVLWLQAAYADGALNYLGLSGSTTAGRVVNHVTDGYIVNGDIKTTSGWNLTAAGVHYWTPSIRSTLWGSYTDVTYNASVRYNSSLPRSGPLSFRDFNIWQAGTALIWSPVAKFDIGVEVLYGRLERSRFNAVDHNQPYYVKRNEDQIQTRLRLQRDF
ncbi:porin [Pseudochelatococcus lubricantis]|uniref:porin n=1 Tax=Pseudochelatococcus lubricantis TaxID=1538102 RepID=UPI0035EE2F1A